MTVPGTMIRTGVCAKSARFRVIRTSAVANSVARQLPVVRERGPEPPGHPEPRFEQVDFAATGRGAVGDGMQLDVDGVMVLWCAGAYDTEYRG